MRKQNTASLNQAQSYNFLYVAYDILNKFVKLKPNLDFNIFFLYFVQLWKKSPLGQCFTKDSPYISLLNKLKEVQFVVYRTLNYYELFVTSNFLNLIIKTKTTIKKSKTVGSSFL